MAAMSDYRNIQRTPETTNPDGSRTWTETWNEPGITRTRVVTAPAWTEDRTDCFCCSCSEFGNSDPYCRNHGFAGERPCETHNMPGTPDDDGVMPESVQAYRAIRA